MEQPIPTIESRLLAREAELARVQRIGQIGGLEVDLREGGFRNTRSPEYLAVHGLPPESVHEPHEAWIQRIHPADRDRVLNHFIETIGSAATDYEVEYRIIRPRDGKTRWILAKAEIERTEDGTPMRLVGAHIDITARRTAEEGRELIARELSHRISNIFTVVNSLVRMGARFEPEGRPFAKKLESRLVALHKAHSFIHGQDAGVAETGLKGLLEGLLEPYREARHDRVTVTGDDAPVDRAASTAFALIFHELATNAVKYGSLSSELGKVTVSIEQTAAGLRITWMETDGPPVSGKAAHSGFGTMMVERAVTSQLGARLNYDWRRDGLVATIDL